MKTRDSPIESAFFKAHVFKSILQERSTFATTRRLEAVLLIDRSPRMWKIVKFVERKFNKDIACSVDVWTKIRVSNDGRFRQAFMGINFIIKSLQ